MPRTENKYDGRVNCDDCFFIVESKDKTQPLKIKYAFEFEKLEIAKKIAIEVNPLLDY